MIEGSKPRAWAKAKRIRMLRLAPRTAAGLALRIQGYQFPEQGADHLLRRDPASFAIPDPFDEVETPLSALNPEDKGVLPFEPLGQGAMGQPRRLPQGTEALLEKGMLRCES